MSMIKDLIEEARIESTITGDEFKPTFRCRRSNWQQFQGICKEEGYTPSMVLRIFIDKVIRESK